MAGLESVFAVDFAGDFRVKVVVSRQQKEPAAGSDWIFIQKRTQEA